MMIPLNPDTVGAQAKLDAWAKETEAKTGIKIRVDGLAARTEFRNLQAEARKLAGATETATKGLLDMGKVSQAAGSIGGLKGILDQVGVSALGMSAAQEKAISQTIGLAQQGVAMGASLGPVGAIVGGVAGALLGLVSAARAAQEAALKLRLDGIEANSKALVAQEVATAGASKAWDTYSVAVLKSRGVTIDALESLRAAGQATFDAEQAARKTRLVAWQEALDKENEIIRVKGLTIQRYVDQSKYEEGIAKVKEEIDNAQIQRNLDLASSVQIQVKHAFDESDKATAKFTVSLGKIGEKATVKSLAADVVTAQTKLDAATAAADKLRKELDKPQTDSGMQKLLIDIKNAAQDVIDAQNGLLGAKSAVVSGPPKASGEAAKRKREAINEANAASNEFGAAVAANDARLAQEEEEATTLANIAAFERQDAANQKLLNADNSAKRALYNAHRTHEQEEAAAQQVALDAIAARYEKAGGNVIAITGTLGAQLEQNIAQGNRALSGMGAALESAVGDILKAKGKEWSVKALGEFAEGLALLGSPVPGSRALATTKFASAAEFGIAAAAAGVGGAVASGDASRRQSGNGNGGGGESATSAGRVTDPGSTTMAPVVVYMGGGPGSTTIHAGSTERDLQQAGANLQRLLDKIRRR